MESNLHSTLCHLLWMSIECSTPCSTNTCTCFYISTSTIRHTMGQILHKYMRWCVSVENWYGAQAHHSQTERLSCWTHYTDHRMAMDLDRLRTGDGSTICMQQELEFIYVKNHQAKMSKFLNKLYAESRKFLAKIGGKYWFFSCILVSLTIFS